MAMYKGWPRITEQIHIADRRRSLSTSVVKSTRIPRFISFPTSACWSWSAEWWAIIRHVRKITFEPTEKQQEKIYEKRTLLVIRYRLIIFALGVFFGYPF